MVPNNQLLRQWVHEYLASEPSGLDVTAYLLDKVGRRYLLGRCGATNLPEDAQRRRFDTEKRRFGKEVKALLVEMFGEGHVHTVGRAAVRRTQWPKLNWVHSYHQHRVDVASRKG